MFALFFLEVFIFILIYKNGGINIIYPPVSNVCPDYWSNSNNLCLIPDNINTGFLNDISLSSIPGYDSLHNGINFRDPLWSSTATTSFCAKKKWANMNNIYWDGITNIDFNNC